MHGIGSHFRGWSEERAVVRRYSDTLYNVDQPRDDKPSPPSAKHSTITSTISARLSASRTPLCPTWGGGNKRHCRSAGRIAQLHAKWNVKVREKGLEGNAVQVLDVYPQEFIKHPQSNAVVRKKMEELRPGYLRHPERMDLAPEHGDWPFEIHHGFTPSERVLSLFQQFFATHPRGSYDARQTRSTYPAVYLGQSTETVRAMAALLHAINQEVGDRILGLLGKRFPEVAAERKAIIEHTWQHNALYDQPEIAGCCAYLKHHAWLCLAIQDGRGNIVHIDMNDDPHQFTVLFTYGMYTQGYFVIPQLNIHIPLQPGQFLFVKTCYLVHYASHFEGVQYVFPGFMDANLCKDYREWKKKQ
ncbi:hypothetical protein DACRYDRAFT_106867 [Dacryopinax primogenitus]|uniref:Uncharacterized protein n=1 Tax=Dacryopinax primogenitus (strain DJM 731) TaxID=1858805 RepID=M5G3L9_DACPD|nr:uncharacterized protein DACRYDRAFT_106867 [Dacryopinax primogenitus]EJU02815.1 hypothetical protein DACRYDRAFT_106867 [Dacryopinax primogenitus]